MAITPRSKGLGNIGGIVNRQRLASPTRPAPKPAPKPVARMPVPKVAPKPMSKANPFTGGKTTTLAQRQANQPFNSSAKPMNKIDPMAGQPMTPPPQPFNPQPNPGQMPNIMPVVRPPLPPQFNQPGQGTQPNFQDIFGPESGQIPDFLKNLRAVAGGPSNIYGQPGLPYTPGSGPDLGAPTPMPGFEIRDMEYRPGRDYEVGGPGDPNMMTPQPGGGIFGGNLPGMVGNAVGQGLGGIFGDLLKQVPPGVDPMSYLGFQGPMGGQQALQTGMQGLGGLFGNIFGNQNSFTMPSPGGYTGPVDYDGNMTMPNPNDFPGLMPSDYDQLEGSSFNTNPSNSGGFMGGNSSGSLFGGGGFAGK